MGMVVLDIGCGVSSLTWSFLKKLSLGDLTVIGVDWDFDFCRRSLKKARKEGADADYLCCDAAFLPFHDGIFDVVLMLDSFRCLKGHPPELFIKEAWSQLRPGGKVYITGLDKVCFGGKRLPIFKDKRFLLNWNLYVPINGSSPWISQEPNIKKNYRYHGVLPHKIVSELLWRCGLEPETSWEVEEVGNYKYYRYAIIVQK
jgi:ubiquinone/menaquinone biosynthesis C-methylase UbiE